MTPWTVACQALLSMEILQAGRLEWVTHWSGLPCPSPGDLPNPGIKPRSPTLQTDSLPAERQGKPKNTGVSYLEYSLSLLQGIFLTQESNWGLLHYRRILYQLSYHNRNLFSHSCGALKPKINVSARASVLGLQIAAFSTVSSHGLLSVDRYSCCLFLFFKGVRAPYDLI